MIQVPDGKIKRNRVLHHIPPTAFPIRWRDFTAGISAASSAQDVVEQFSHQIATQVGSQHTYLVNSGRSALTLILKSLRTANSSNKVLIPAYSCSTVLQSVLEAGLEPIFCDVSLDTLNFDEAEIMEKIEEKPLAVVGVHLYGLAQDFSEIVALSRQRGIVFIEDAAQAFGARIRGKLAGMQGDFGLFSLGSGKCLPVGGGGVIVADGPDGSKLESTLSDEIEAGKPSGLHWLVKLLTYRLAVNPLGWWIVNRSSLNPAEAGGDFQHLPEISHKQLSQVQAGIGLSQLQRAEENYQVWRTNASVLSQRLREFDFIKLPEISEGSQPVYLRLPIVLDNPAGTERLFNKLEKAGIGVSRSYRFTLPGVYSEHKPIDVLDFPGADHLSRCLLTLPTNVYLDGRAIEKIYTVFKTELEKGWR
jgi:dTDP-4-amino-4,6-dideoxygalactose transaminase